MLLVGECFEFPKKLENCEVRRYAIKIVLQNGFGYQGKVQGAKLCDKSNNTIILGHAKWIYLEHECKHNID